jgi:hypothetical protein
MKIFYQGSFAKNALQSYLGIMAMDGKTRGGTEGAGQASGPAGADDAGQGQAGTVSQADAARGRTATRLTDPRALRAYAHPVRMALMGLLRTEGPLTATRAAELLGESSGTTSFHLRQLAKYGLVEEAGGGTGREKPWRVTATSTDWDATGDGTPEAAAAASLLSRVLAEQYFEQLMRWLDAFPHQPAEWQEAAMLGDRLLYVTPAELEELRGRVGEILDGYFERQLRPELRPAGARVVTWLNIAFPNDFRRP